VQGVGIVLLDSADGSLLPASKLLEGGHVVYSLVCTYGIYRVKVEGIYGLLYGTVDKAMQSAPIDRSIDLTNLSSLACENKRWLVAVFPKLWTSRALRTIVFIRC
jgi:hypothetical protein